MNKTEFKNSDIEKWVSGAYGMFEASRNDSRAQQMSAYMRNQFPFFGLTSGERREMQKSVFQKVGVPGKPLGDELIHSLWSWDEREGQYFAMEIMWKHRNEADPHRISLIERLIQYKSWWDTIDVLAPKLAFAYFKKFPDAKHDIIRDWNQSNNMWLQRSSLVVQLFDKKDTDIGLLTECILRHQQSREFFIQKAMGWVLRNYARTNADFVRKFTESNNLPRLTIREAMKHL